VVELLESTNSPESFIVRALGQQPENSVAPVTQIPPQRDIVLQAIGGNGEPGRRGGDGGPGRDGIAGIDATEVLDATVRCIVHYLKVHLNLTFFSQDQTEEMGEGK
jgi:hypothetical protein